MSLPPPPPADTLQVVHIDSLAAALAKLKVDIKIEGLIKVVHDEDEAKHVKVAAEATQRRGALSKRESVPPLLARSLTMNLANASSRSPTNRGNCRPQIHDRLRVHRQAYQTRPCRSIGEGTSSSSPRTYRTVLSRRQGFGSVLIDWLSWSQDVAANKLPFIVTSATDTSDNPPQSVFENTWCLWDTGAQTSFMVTSQLGVAVRDNKTEGNAIMDIKCVLFHYS